MIRSAAAGIAGVALALAPVAVMAAPVDAAVPMAKSQKACNSKNLLHSLEIGSHMKKYTCAYVGGDKWAAVLLKEGPTLYFEKYMPKGNHWNVYMADEICGTASAGFPASLLDYCKYA